MNFFFCAVVFFFSAPVGHTIPQDVPVVEAPRVAVTPLARDYSQAYLDRMGQAAFEAVCSVKPTKLKSLRFKFVERSEMEKVLYEELRPQMDCQFEDAEVAEANAQTMATTLASAVLAKFATGSGDVLVVHDNIFDIAELLHMPDLASTEVLSAVLCHEAAHALDHHRHPLPGLFGRVTDTDHLQAINAVIEGHAQHVARKACKKMDNMVGFDLFTASIDHLPEAEDAHQAYVGRIVVAQFSFAYKDGERFIDAMALEGGASAIEKVFQAPPTESILITEPSWYLKPKSRPKVPYDLEQALQRYEASLHKEDPDHWMMTKVELLAPQISAAFSLLPKDRYEQSVKDILECRVLVAQNLDGEGSMISAGLFALSTVPKAKQFLELENDLIAIKPEKLKETITITIDKTEKLTKKDSTQFEGIWIEQTIIYGATPVKNNSLLAHRGQIVAELNFSNVGITKKEAIKAAESLLQAPTKTPEEKASSEKATK